MSYKKIYHGFEIPINGRLGYYTYELGEDTWNALMAELSSEQKERLGLKEPRPSGRYSWPGPL